MTVICFGGRDFRRTLCGPAAGKPGQRVWGCGKETGEGKGIGEEWAEDGVTICKCS